MQRTLEADLIARWRAARRLTLEQLAERCHQSVAAIGSLERRTESRIAVDKLLAVAAGLGVPGATDSDRLARFFQGPEAPAAAKPAAGPELAKAQHWTYLPKVAWTAAGTPIDYEVPEQDRTWYAFHRSWAEQMAARDAPDDDQRLVMVEVGEDQESMWPTLRPGAVLVVDRGREGKGITALEEVRQGRIYLCRPGDEGITAKYVTVDRRMGALVLSSDNPDRERYPPLLIPLRGLELQRVLLGLVVHVGQDLAPRARPRRGHGDHKGDRPSKADLAAMIGKVK